MKGRSNSMLIFIVPVYNEEKNIGLLLDNTKRFAGENNYEYKMVIINDGSTDRTMNILEGYQKNTPIVVLDQKTNKGVGEAFKRGFTYAAEMANDEDIIISKEADNTSDLSILSEMINKVRQGYDLALASCYAKGGGIEGTSFYRKALSRGANFILRISSNMYNVYTFSSFYRAYKGKLIKRAYSVYGDKLIQEKGFACMVELLFKLNKLHINIVEVPMILNSNLRKGKSKMKTFNTTLAYIRLIARNLLAN